MSALPRGRCRLCQRSVAVRVSGELREHRFAGAAQAICPGSLMPASWKHPRELRAWARRQINQARAARQ